MKLCMDVLSLTRGHYKLCQAFTTACHSSEWLFMQAHPYVTPTYPSTNRKVNGHNKLIVYCFNITTEITFPNYPN